ncbi:MAG: hypothetical protein N3J91_00070 [Verrucomicrobiae bacterium]|nr:hypothetical protein [Verrucomicrobiae bacterium]
MKSSLTCRIGVALVLALLAHPAWPATPKAHYTIVVSQSTQADAGWKKVVEALKAKHQASVVTYEREVTEALLKLRAGPYSRYVCFVARPEEATRKLVGQVHRMMRQLDEDPYTDGFWGILTGYDATNALRIAQYRKPLTVRKVASGTEIALEQCEEGFWYDELVKNKHVRKDKGGPVRVLQGPDDTTEALVKSLNEYQPDLFVTSGHATERDWMIGFRYQNGFFKCAQGQLYGEDTRKQKHPIHSPNPKVYLPIGNCLMGHIDSREAMALAWMNSAGVMQMIGYTVPTWYGYAGWGCLDYFVEQPGRYTFTEAFFANQHALIHRLKTYFPGTERFDPDTAGSNSPPVVVTEQAKAAGLSANDARGLFFDRDVVAFYGDPAWVARMAEGPRAYEQTLEVKKDRWTLTLKLNRGERSFAPVNTNGSQRGGRPIVAFLPVRVRDVRVEEGADLQPEIADDFILIPNPRQADPHRVYRVVFRATPLP